MTDDRKVILNAAAREFAEVGLHESSLASVAERAGSKEAAVRAVFIDKSTLLKELLKEATDPLVSGIAMAVEKTEDPSEVIRKSLQLYDLWLLDHPEITRIMVRCALDAPEWLGELYQESLMPSEFYERLQQLIDKDRFRCKDLFVLSLLFDSLILLPHMVRSSLELMLPGQSAEEILQTRFEAIMDLFDHGLYKG